jgi:predicted nucleotidyltransferase
MVSGVLQMTSDQLQMELAPIFAKYDTEIVAAYLFGSAATGMTSNSSDIDIAVLMRTKDRRCGSSLKLRLYADMCRKLGRNDIDIVLLDLAGNLILNDEIVRHGKILYTTDADAKETFELAVLHRCTDFKFQRRFAMGV